MPANRANCNRVAASSSMEHCCCACAEGPTDLFVMYVKYEQSNLANVNARSRQGCTRDHSRVYECQSQFDIAHTQEALRRMLHASVARPNYY
ncbi:unnamed protein product [Sphagnum balticum]